MKVSVCAQEKFKLIDLVSYLNLIESKHEVIFSYADEELQSVMVPLGKDFKTLEELLNHLSQNTPFTFRIQEGNNILVVPLPHSKKACIQIFDAITQHNVPFAILNHNAIMYKADQTGTVHIPVDSETIELKIFADDFITQEFTIQTKEACSPLYISPFYQTLDEVFLTSLLTRGIQKIASGGLEINYEEFGLLPGLIEPDVLQSLQALPGIVSREESVSYLNVRGGTHDQNLFLWDGIKMYNTSHFFGMISAFNPYLTQEVKLIKNGTSAKYGDGVSSLIDMKTSNTITDSLETSLGMNLIHADAMLKVPINSKASVVISSRHSINSLWESPTYNQYFDKVFQNTEVTNFETQSLQQNNDFSFFDATTTLNYKITNKDLLKLNFIYAQDDFNLNRFDVERPGINTRASQLQKTNLAGGLFWERNWSKSTTTQFQFYTSEYNLNAVNTNLLNQQRLEQDNRIREFGFKLNIQSQISPELRLESGYQFNETGILNAQKINEPGFFSEIQNSILTNSLNTQLNYQSENKRLNLNLGGRLNHYTEFDEIVVEPRFNLSYRFVKDLFLEILAEQKSQVTSQTIDLQTDFLGVENRRWVLSEPGNRPIIESQQVSAGLNFVKPSWFVNIDFFYKKVDGITTQGQGFQNQFEFSEDHGSYGVKGMDILVNKNFEPLSGWISYSLSENNYNFNRLNPSSFHNNLDIRHVVSTGISYEKKGLKLSTGFNWHSGATTTLTLANQDNLPQQILFDTPNGARLKDYFRIDFSSTYTFPLFKNTQALAGVSFLNVFDNTNVYNQFYSINGEGHIQTFNQNGLGFTPNVVFRIKF